MESRKSRSSHVPVPAPVVRRPFPGTSVEVPAHRRAEL